MTIKGVSKSLCDERSGNIMKQLDNIDKKVDIIMENHLPHLKSDMARYSAITGIVITIMVGLLQFIIR